MKQTVQEHDFLDAFRRYGRADQFTRAGLIALLDYLEDYEEQLHEQLELDVIALCCNYSEYGAAIDAARKNGYEYDPDSEDAEDHTEQAALAWLRDQTTVIEFDGGVIVGAF